MGTAPVEASRVNPQALRVHLKVEIFRWSPLIKLAGVYAD